MPKSLDLTLEEKAIRHYKNQQQAKKKYQLKNVEKLREYGRNYFQEIVKNDPERIERYKISQKAYYQRKKKEKEMQDALVEVD